MEVLYFLRNIYRISEKIIFANIFKDCIEAIYFSKKIFPISMISMIGTSLGYTEKVAFPKGKDISEKKFVSRNLFKNKMPAHMGTPTCVSKCVSKNKSVF